MSTVTVDRILVAWKAYDQQECQLGQLTGIMLLRKQQLIGMSTLTVDRILVARKSTANKKSTLRVDRWNLGRLES